ncbi:hypothetical protein V8D89_008367 [Ganoderma adspersum]
MASGLDIWGAIASAIGVLSVIQIIWTIIHGRLPNQCIHVFEQTLADTQALLNSVSEEGLFTDNGHYVTHAKTRISNICKRLDGLREESFEAKTYKQELKQWWGGLSRRISVCNKELKGLRAEISVTSSKAREALAQQLQDVESNEPSPVPAAEFPIVNSGLSGNTYAGRSVHCSSIEADTDGSTVQKQLAQDGPAGAEECKDDFGASTSSNGDLNKGSDVEIELCTLHGASQRPLRSHSIDTLPPYRRQSIPPSYPPCTTPLCSCAPAPVSETPVIRTTSLLSRCIAADSARATRKLIKAYRRNLMVHNVPWKPQGAPHTLHGTSAAASARAVDRPSNNTRHWKLLEGRSRAPLSSYVAVLSHEAIIDASRHGNSTVPA